IHYTHLICKNRVAAERNRLTLRDALPICTRWRKAPPADDLRSSQFSHKGNPESDPDPSRAPPVRRDALDSRIRCLRTHGAHNREGFPLPWVRAYELGATRRPYLATTCWNVSRLFEKPTLLLLVRPRFSIAGVPSAITAAKSSSVGDVLKSRLNGLIVEPPLSRFQTAC